MGSSIESREMMHVGRLVGTVESKKVAFRTYQYNKRLPMMKPPMVSGSTLGGTEEGEVGDGEGELGEAKGGAESEVEGVAKRDESETGPAMAGLTM
jgi:hypothetical protein